MEDNQMSLLNDENSRHGFMENNENNITLLQPKDETISQMFDENFTTNSMDIRDAAINVEGVEFVDNEKNLELPQMTDFEMDETEPFSYAKMMGTMLREGLDVRNYWQAMENLGAEFARYKWAHDEGELGEFDARKFGKEVLKSGVRNIGQTGLNTLGSMLSIMGANMQSKHAYALLPIDSGLNIGAKVGEIIEDLGGALKEYAQDVTAINFLAPAEDFDDDKLNYTKLANVIGSGAAQALAMTLTARFLGAKAAYGLFAVSSAGDVFDETLEATDDLAAANLSAATNAGLTYGIDKIFNPLPKHLAKGAKLSAKEIAKEAIGSPLREAGSEVLQQMLAENLVRKAGIDDTQDLFEGLVESALGAFAGSGMVGVSGAMYQARQNYSRARERMLAKGVSAEELDLAEQGMLQLLSQNPEAFEKILKRNFEANVALLKNNAKKIKDKQKKEETLEVLSGFPKVYDEVYQQARQVLKDEAKAKIAAAMIGAGAVSFYKKDNSLTPHKIIENYLPQFKQMNYNQFLALHAPDEAVSYMFAGQRAKGADLAKLSDAVNMLDQKVDPQKVWQYTGWSMGADGQARFEFSDKDAQLNVFSKRYKSQPEKDVTLDEIHLVEESKAKLTELLTNSAHNQYDAYYKEFWKYLENRRKNQEFVLSNWVDDASFVKYNYMQLIDDKDVAERMAQDKYLNSLWTDYQNKSRDFSEQEYEMIRAIAENRRYRNFIEKYWDSHYGINQDFVDFLAEKGAEQADNPLFIKQLERLEKDVVNKRNERTKTLDDLGLSHQRAFYQDLDLDMYYRQYVLFSGDYSDEPADRNFRLPQYKSAFAPKTASEHFLAQDKYSFLPEAQKQKIAEYLDRVDILFRLDKQLENLQNEEKMSRSNSEGKWVYIPQGVDEIKEEVLSNGKGFNLGELLSHEKLYANYPELFDTVVEFKKLQDDAAYHFYHDLEKGMVLEIDAEQLDYQHLKETLLKGAAFAIEDIEGFDYSLADKDKRNFMDRQVYLARQELAPMQRERLREFLARYNISENEKMFIKEEVMPIALAGLAESREKGKTAPKVVKISSVDYDAIGKIIDKYYGAAHNEDENFIKKRAYYELQFMKDEYMRQVNALSRINGGYSGAWLPWGGEQSQGAIDERLMLKRQNYSEYELMEQPFHKNLKMMRGRVYEPDVMNPYEEYEQRIREDYKHKKQMLKNMALGAYEYGTKTINLFENGDARTIVHESFHYFWDMLNSDGVKNNNNALDFMAAMEELRWSFIKQYKVEEHEGKYYAIERKSKELMQEMPIGFASANEAVEAGIREMFVDKFMQVMDDKLYPSEDMGEAMDFYREYLNELVGSLDIKPKKSGAGGQKLLQFIKKKIVGGKSMKEKYDDGVSAILNGMNEARNSVKNSAGEGMQYAANEYAGVMNDGMVERGENVFEIHYKLGAPSFNEVYNSGLDDNSLIQKSTKDFEGGYVELKNDRGGKTNYGVTQKTLDDYNTNFNASYKTGGGFPKNIEELSPLQAKTILCEMFFRPYNINYIPNLKICRVVFDSCVLGGPKMNQLFLDEINKLTGENFKFKLRKYKRGNNYVTVSDPVIPSKAAELVADLSKEQIIALSDKLVEGRMKYHFRDIEENNSQIDFLEGWYERARCLYSDTDKFDSLFFSKKETFLKQYNRGK